MKYLVMGCNGMAGHLIALYLQENGHEVVGFARNDRGLVNTVVGDAFDKELIKKTINEGNFDSVVNCIGILNQFAEEHKSEAVYLNSLLPHFLSEICAPLNTQVIHISTDCVFSGKKGNYGEHDFKDGETFYDRTKALGELEDNKNCTLRNSIIGPDINENGIGLFNWFMKQSGIINGFDKAIWTGQTTLQLAKTVEYVSKNRIVGLYNSVPTTSITKFELLQLFKKHLNRYDIEIKKVDGLNVNKSLISSSVDFCQNIPEYETMIIEMAEWIKNHKNIYKHYNV